MKNEKSERFEKPEMIRITSVKKHDTAMGPDGCSTKYSGCCYKD